MTNYAKLIDHTLLKPDATKEQIRKLCEEAIHFQFHSVCVNPTWVKYAKEQLKDTDVFVCTVVGFPLGATTSEVKAFEAKNAIKHGADEIDMVIHIGALKDGEDITVLEDIRAVVDAANGKTVKVIFETSLLTDDEKRKACELSIKAGANFVKTSTGFANGGATVEDVLLMKKEVGTKLEVKASGGIRSLESVKNMVQAGATRIGTSSGVKIMNELNKEVN